MSVLVFAENWEGKFKKSTFEAVSYAAEVAKMIGTTVTAVAIGNLTDDTLKLLGKYGAIKVVAARDERLVSFTEQAYASVIAEAAQREGATVIVLSYTYTGKALAGRIAIKTKAGLVAGAVTLPKSTTPLVVRKKCFSGKALTDVSVSSANAVIALTPNSYQVKLNEVSITVEAFSTTLKDADFRTVTKEVKKTAGKIVLTEAEIVVSGGRGLKGPENWGLIETLANELGAATACSKPVADMGWRPHHEHVGQTGITIGPNLYIAIGISGAIQHLAGVSSSKVIAVINADKEAPFFKNADYGIVGDALEVVPKLIEAAKELKASQH